VKPGKIFNWTSLGAHRDIFIIKMSVVDIRIEAQKFYGIWHEFVFYYLFPFFYYAILGGRDFMQYKGIEMKWLINY